MARRSGSAEGTAAFLNSLSSLSNSRAAHRSVDVENARLEFAKKEAKRNRTLAEQELKQRADQFEKSLNFSIKELGSREAMSEAQIKSTEKISGDTINASKELESSRQKFEGGQNVLKRTFDSAMNWMRHNEVVQAAVEATRHNKAMENLESLRNEILKAQNEREAKIQETQNAAAKQAMLNNSISEMVAIGKSLKPEDQTAFFGNMTAILKDQYGPIGSYYAIAAMQGVQQQKYEDAFAQVLPYALQAYGGMENPGALMGIVSMMAKNMTSNDPIEAQRGNDLFTDVFNKATGSMGQVQGQGSTGQISSNQNIKTSNSGFSTSLSKTANSFSKEKSTNPIKAVGVAATQTASSLSNTKVGQSTLSSMGLNPRDNSMEPAALMTPEEARRRGYGEVSWFDKLLRGW